MPRANRNYLHETYLTLPEVEASIALLERKHGVSTSEFLREPSVRARIPEDATFEWDAYLDHRTELRRINRETHQRCLSDLHQARKS